MCDSFLKNYDTFLPPSKDTVNLLQGVNDFQNKTLHVHPIHLMGHLRLTLC